MANGIMGVYTSYDKGRHKWILLYYKSHKIAISIYIIHPGYI